MRYPTYAAAAAATTVSTVAMGQNLVVNGGFEGSTPAACNGFVTLSAGSASIPGWTVNGTNTVDWSWARSTGPCCDWAPEGDRTVDLNGSPAQNGSSVRQIIQTVPGERYRLALLARANGCCSSVGSTKTLRITAGSTISEHVLIVDGQSDCIFDGWTHIERIWIADSAQSQIELRSLVPSSAGGPTIDAVSVELVDCPADTDDSGFVDGVDLAIILTNWGPPSPKYPAADVNGDGDVNGADLAIVLSSWGACP